VSKQEFLAIIDKYLKCLTSGEEEDLSFRYYDSYQLCKEEMNIFFLFRSN
jgi:hypothetical protein